MLEALKQTVYEANMALPANNLVTLTWGNVSQIDRDSGLFVIKPSGVAYDELTPADMVVVDLDGRVVEGELNPSSDTPTHADTFYGDVPIADRLTQEEVDGDYELNTGQSIVRVFDRQNLDPMATPGVLTNDHGPFTWGKNAKTAVQNAIVLDVVSEIDFHTMQLNPTQGLHVPQYLLDRHYFRKHGAHAYYGQGTH
ncbi:class II aldolase/adducin family protein [Leuconostoc lactis]|uniref:class II aldolase/adducin family protein n=1 Tax=Leuconostoc lactis TaxID=1246 RepID=UPI0021A91919|nr:class II aldolase/adducin family protein [Leuconostoc lactis]MCT3115834.1 L-ribulose-5-phosphate 4-epimerase [Leuconostoc lactis]